MGQPKKKTSLDQVLKLVDQLSPDEQQQLGETLHELAVLRKAVDAGIDQLDRGLGIPAEEAFQRLRERFENKAQNK